jgi:xylulokinase
MSLVAGVDSSTQSCSVVVCDTGTGKVLRSGHAAHPPGTEVSAQAWADAYAEATRDPALLDGVEALAVGGQQHGMVTLDSDGALVRDALLWNDNRSGPDAADLIAELGGPQAWADQVGSVPPASFTVTKLRWLARAEPENAERTAAVLLPHDWLTWHLGGRSFDPVTDRGDASGTGYFDATANAYRDGLVRLALGHDLRLPAVAGPDAVVGETPEGIRLAPGTGDNMAAGLGLGLTPGTAVVSLGTSGTAFTTSAVQSHDPTGTVAGFADATGAFLPLVCTLNAARNLSATAALLGVDFAEFARLALSAPPGSGGLAFVPYLEGERTPPLPTATGELVGMSLTNLVPANLARAAIEGILWSLAFGLRVLQQHGGSIERVVLTGGAAQSAAVQQIAPAVFGLPVTVTDVAESVAVGAARQAAWALTGTLPDWPVPQVRTIEATEDDRAAATMIDERYSAAVTEHYPVDVR